MLKYTTIKSRVYIESTVVSYLVARPSNNPILAARQRASRQLWEDYADRFEFVISRIVRAEIQRGDVTAAQQRLEVVLPLTVLEVTPEVNMLTQKLLDAGTVPRNSEPDAQHIAIATVHSVEYLVSWNHKHIANENKREHINQVCQEAGFQPTTICTPIELMEDIQMKETSEKHPEFDPETYTDPILEECYRIKAEISAQFKTLEEFFAYIRAGEEEDKRKGIKYVSYYDPSKRIPVEKSEDDN
ncbi:MAG: type II toxin-antitoxin system VapC family toxin [Candidatus Poribacteria bacterium]|nr:type II toxin-antitoxin system VapC family toxin [Candidatus Poribacteria bacterium]MDE0467248.1 type II toxin-antitoxin system VapC family toxin [Candidatus Poribacteria bacterium]